MRDEGKPELDYKEQQWDHISLKIISHVGQTAFYCNSIRMRIDKLQMNDIV